MKFGIIVCPKCRRAKAIKLTCKTTRCPFCNHTIKISKRKIFHKTDSRKEIQNAIGLVNADIDGRYDDFKKQLEEKKKKQDG
ncbi:MAG: DUF1922 domain-containing protein [Candidatus Thermoplasmatota archaeon]